MFRVSVNLLALANDLSIRYRRMITLEETRIVPELWGFRDFDGINEFFSVDDPSHWLGEDQIIEVEEI